MLKNNVLKEHIIVSHEGIHRRIIIMIIYREAFSFFQYVLV